MINYMHLSLYDDVGVCRLKPNKQSPVELVYNMLECVSGVVCFERVYMHGVKHPKLTKRALQACMHVVLLCVGLTNHSRQK